MTPREAAAYLAGALRLQWLPLEDARERGNALVTTLLGFPELDAVIVCDEGLRQTPLADWQRRDVARLWIEIREEVRGG